MSPKIPFELVNPLESSPDSNEFHGFRQRSSLVKKLTLIGGGIAIFTASCTTPRSTYEATPSPIEPAVPLLPTHEAPTPCIPPQEINDLLNESPLNPHWFLWDTEKIVSNPNNPVVMYFAVEGGKIVLGYSFSSPDTNVPVSLLTDTREYPMGTLVQNSFATPYPDGTLAIVYGSMLNLACNDGTLWGAIDLIDRQGIVELKPNKISPSTPGVQG